MMKKAFTLAETIITLAIIGVAAAIAIPSIANNYQKEQTVTKLKKAYTELNQALLSAQVENGTFDVWDLSDFDTSNDRNTYFTENYLLPHLKVLKSCIPSSSECFSDEIYSLDGTASSMNTGKSASFIALSGYSVYYWVHGTGGGGWFYIDINGLKGPNIIGKDVFFFTASWGEPSKVSVSSGDNCIQYKAGLYPHGLECASLQLSRDDMINGTYNIATSTNWPNNCKKGSSGLAQAGGFCSGLIALDGWQIKDDYPW